MATVSWSLRMLLMKSEVGWARQSGIGQLQLHTRFCSIRAVKYSCQHDWRKHTHTHGIRLDFHPQLHPFLWRRY